MSDFKFNCPHCKQSLEAPHDMRGTAISCPSCNRSITIPSAVSSASAAPPASPISSGSSVKSLASKKYNLNWVLLTVVIALGIIAYIFNAQEKPADAVVTQGIPAPFEAASPIQIEKLKMIQLADKNISESVYVVLSQHHQNAYYISTKIYGPGIENGEAAVWLLNGSKTAPGIQFLAVDGTALQYTGAPNYNRTIAGAGPGASMDLEARSLEEYVERTVQK